MPKTYSMGLLKLRGFVRMKRRGTCILWIGVSRRNAIKSTPAPQGKAVYCFAHRRVPQRALEYQRNDTYDPWEERVTPTYPRHSWTKP